MANSPSLTVIFHDKLSFVPTSKFPEKASFWLAQYARGAHSQCCWKNPTDKLILYKIAAGIQQYPYIDYAKVKLTENKGTGKTTH